MDYRWDVLRDWLETQKRTVVNYDVYWSFEFVLNKMNELEKYRQTNTNKQINEVNK